MPLLAVEPLESESLRSKAYTALKAAITNVDIYGSPEPVRLDERSISEQLGVSRTPIREAVTMLEQEGFVKTEPRRGIVIVRKTKREIVDIIEAWAALESMAARQITLRATNEDIASLRGLFERFTAEYKPKEHVGEYSDANLAFHQTLIRLSGSPVLIDLTSNLLMHVRAIRKMTISQDDRASRSIVDHLNIIAALERRDTLAAEQLARQHTLDLATHVEKHCTFLD